MTCGGDREELILGLAAQVKILARRYFRSVPFPSTVEREDMLAEAWIGAILAVDGFDPGLGLSLRTYAERRIRGRILDYLRRMDLVTRKERRKIKGGEAAAPVIISVLDFDLTDDQALQDLGRFEAELDVGRLLERAELSDRHQLVLRQRYWTSGLDRELARQLGVTESRVSQLHTQAIRRLRAVSAT